MSEAIQPLNLYQITTELQQLEQALLESGGVLTDEIEEKYETLLEMEADKVEGYIAMIRKFEASEEAIKSERQRLQKAERSMRKAAQSLKDRLAESMLRRGEEVHETDLGKVRLQQASRASLVVNVDPEELPEEFQRWKVSADKAGLRAAIEDDDEVAKQFAHLDEPSHYIRLY